VFSDPINRIVTAHDHQDGRVSEAPDPIDGIRTEDPDMAKYSVPRDNRWDLLLADPVNPVVDEEDAEMTVNTGVNNSSAAGQVFGVNSTLDQEYKVARFF